jgi:Integrase core domain
VLTRPIRWELIAQQYDQMVKRATGLRLRTAEAEAILRRFTRPVAERFVGIIGRECLNRIVILGRRHLEAVLAEYIERQNRHHPHQSLNQRPPWCVRPARWTTWPKSKPVHLRRHDVFHGTIHEYRLTA